MPAWGEHSAEFADHGDRLVTSMPGAHSAILRSLAEPGLDAILRSPAEPGLDAILRSPAEPGLDAILRSPAEPGLDAILRSPAEPGLEGRTIARPDVSRTGIPGPTQVRPSRLALRARTSGWLPPCSPQRSASS